METRVISVLHDMAEEAVAAVIAKYDLLAVPVVDGENRLLGIITVDDVIDILEAENTEDFQRISAVVPFEEGYFKRSLPRLFWNRFIWLAVLLFTSILSTTIMEMNSAVLHQMVALAFFIPLVTGTCGNAGTQSATMVVRALALGEIAPGDFLRVFRRELFMGMALGVALGLMAYFRVFLQDHRHFAGVDGGGCLVGHPDGRQPDRRPDAAALEETPPGSGLDGRPVHCHDNRRRGDHALFSDCHFAHGLDQNMTASKKRRHLVERIVSVTFIGRWRFPGERHHGVGCNGAGFRRIR